MEEKVEAPEVTLILVSYNQQDFIQRAVEGALAQTFSPLKIIISDDYSTDSTFEIIRETVSSYQGPHHVTLNRNEANLGLISHVSKVVDLCTTELIVGQAGDDISLPERVAQIMEVWRTDPSVDAICSSAIVIDSQGKKIGDQRLKDQFVFTSKRDQLLSRTLMNGCFLYGATAAFKKSLYSEFPPILSGAAEDAVIGFRALMLGGVRQISRPLLNYRKHESNIWSLTSRLQNEALRVKRAKMLLCCLKQNKIDLEHLNELGKIDSALTDEMRALLEVNVLLTELDTYPLETHDYLIRHQLAEKWLATLRRTDIPLTSNYIKFRIIRILNGILRRWIARDIRRHSNIEGLHRA